MYPRQQMGKSSDDRDGGLVQTLSLDTTVTKILI